MDSVNAVKLPSANLKKASFKKFSSNKFHFPLLLIVFMLFFVSGWSLGGWQRGILVGKEVEIFVVDYEEIWPWSNGGPTAGWTDSLRHKTAVCNRNWCWTFLQSGNNGVGAWLNDGRPYNIEGWKTDTDRAPVKSVKLYCAPNTKSCSDNTPRVCKSDGTGWTNLTACTSNQTCQPASGTCVANECSSSQTGTRACSITNGTGSQTRTCTASGSWGSWGTCTLVSCNSGFHQSGNACVANECTNGALECFSSTVPKKCIGNVWVNQTACASYQTCQSASGTCVNNSTYCETNDDRICSNDIPQLCVNHEWEAQTACTAGKECANGTCVDIGGYCDQDSDCADNQECKLDTNNCQNINCITINDCKEITAQNHTCVETNKPDGTSCPDGICSSGVCTSSGADFLISLDIDLEVKDDDTSDEVVVRLKKDGVDIPDQTVAVDSSGRKTDIGFNDLEEGEYRLIVKPKGYLSRAINITLTEGETIEASFPEVFLAGDLNETSYNMVNSLDYAIFKNEDHYNTNDRVADFNGDGLVNTLDYSIFVRNFNKTGEE